MEQIKHQPYTYLLHHIPTNTFYYGVRWAKNCIPDEFWVKYFTSSKKLIPLLRTLFGDESFEYEIRRTFKNKESAVKWEEKLLRRMKVLDKQDVWLNRNIAGAILNSSMLNVGRIPYNKGKTGLYQHTIKHKQRMKIVMLNNTNGSGNSPSIEQKKKISERMIGNIYGAGGRGIPKKKISCTVCGLIGGNSNMKRYHFENCKKRSILWN